ncbi:M20 aminoacylase family protein [Rouxiella chamberiensis]|uniref:M20 family metallopeptidase n=1 Tax=Rouxiella chamberiensis TaxID=1513468 RepID=A0ABY7HTY2_9GAMM|nr:M20 aminoacylase family protein [Rouxiella chamberiensis]WAT02820.1 M20 family metallopeptidase [Rouxiella chamberiensis]
MNNKNLCTLADVADLEPGLREIRQHLHQHPELSNEEANTAELVAGKLHALGFEVSTGVGGFGVVGSLKVGNGTRSIGIRADMDALPITELTGLDYASQTPGKMHACGHDGHTAMLLGAAEQLARSRNFSGTVHLIFQPAEEIGFNSGAERMLAEGLFDRFPCDAVYGLHNHPGYPVGKMMFRPGPFMAACDTVNITIHGKGGHAARPHMTVDPILVASSLVVALQTVISRNIDPNETAVITIGSLHSGHAANVIPDTARLEMSVRSFDKGVRKILEERITSLVTRHAEGYGATAEIDYVPGYPVLVNHHQETEFATKVAQELLGEENVVADLPPISGSEDFAYFLQQKPGCFLRLGNGDSAVLHNPAYNFNDDSLPFGVAYWTRLVERYLAE